MMKEIGNGLWVAECDFVTFGLELGGRMSAVRLADGGLLLYNVIAIDDELAAELADIGEVRHIIAPNSFHYFYLAAAKERYPDAAVYLAPALAKKRSELAGHTILDPGNAADPSWPWRDDLDTIVVDGAPRVDEVILYHRASRTLVVCDLVFHMREHRGLFGRMFFRLLGIHGKFRQSPLWRLLLTRDRQAAAASLQPIWGWDLERVIVAHGPIVEGSDSKERLAEALRWMCRREQLAPG